MSDLIFLLSEDVESIDDYNRVVSQYPFQCWDQFKFNGGLEIIDFDIVQQRLQSSSEQSKVPFTPYELQLLIREIPSYLNTFSTKITYQHTDTKVTFMVSSRFESLPQDFNEYLPPEFISYKDNLLQIDLDMVSEVLKWIIEPYPVIIPTINNIKIHKSQLIVMNMKHNLETRKSNEADIYFATRIYQMLYENGKLEPSQGYDLLWNQVNDKRNQVSLILDLPNCIIQIINSYIDI